jgi:hypothetical protein
MYVHAVPKRSNGERNTTNTSHAQRLAAGTTFEHACILRCVFGEGSQSLDEPDAASLDMTVLLLIRLCCVNCVLWLQHELPPENRHHCLSHCLQAMC